MSKVETPILDGLEARGVVWGKQLWPGKSDDRDWLGRAADGTVLSFGISTRRAMERYLRDYPTPDKW